MLHCIRLAYYLLLQHNHKIKILIFRFSHFLLNIKNNTTYHIFSYKQLIILVYGKTCVQMAHNLLKDTRISDICLNFHVIFGTCELQCLFIRINMVSPVRHLLEQTHSACKLQICMQRRTGKKKCWNSEIKQVL